MLGVSKLHVRTETVSKGRLSASQVSALGERPPSRAKTAEVEEKSVLVQLGGADDQSHHYFICGAERVSPFCCFW